MKFIVHTDGGARGNPGPAAVGVVIETDSRKQIAEFGKRIGETTNNVAEYNAVLEGLRNIKYQIANSKYEDNNNITIQFYLDSMLVVNQLNGKFKVKDTKLRELMMQVKILEGEIGGMISYQYIPREENQRADFLVNQALDGAVMSSSLSDLRV